MRDEALMAVAGCLAMVLVAVILSLCVMAGIRATDADRAYRSARAEACRTINDQALRTLCLVKP